MARIVCLAVSRKHSNFCVAGIDLKHNTWIYRHDGAIPEAMMALPGEKKPSLLDILEIPLADRQKSGDFQPENYYLDDKPWRKVGRVPVESLVGYTKLSRSVLHNYSDRISPYELNVFPKVCRSSLQLVECTNAVFFRDPRNSQAWRTTFTVFGHEYNLRITDPRSRKCAKQRADDFSAMFSYNQSHRAMALFIRYGAVLLQAGCRYHRASPCCL